jgi:hypothetical protein
MAEESTSPNRFGRRKELADLPLTWLASPRRSGANHSRHTVFLCLFETGFLGKDWCDYGSGLPPSHRYPADSAARTPNATANASWASINTYSHS